MGMLIITPKSFRHQMKFHQSIFKHVRFLYIICHVDFESNYKPFIHILILNFDSANNNIKHHSNNQANKQDKEFEVKKIKM